MRRTGTKILPLLVLCVAFTTVAAQTDQGTPASDLTNRDITAIGYPVGKETKVDMKSTDLMPQAAGEAKVKARAGATSIEIQIQNMSQPTTFGAKFLTYVLWAVSPEGRTNNLGEIFIDSNGQGKLIATTPLQTFSLFVTAEPYFGVRRPSELLILQNGLSQGSKAKIFPVANYPLMKRSQYQELSNPLALTLDTKNVPLEMYEARNAVDIAKNRGAEKYAPETLSKATASLQMAENSLTKKANTKIIISNGRQTVQFAEDARALTEERKEAERIANEKAAATAKAKADAEAKAAEEAAVAKRQADAEAARQAELAAAKQAQMKAEADAAATRAKAEADSAAAKAQAEQDALKAKEQAAQADAERSRQAAEALRAQLLDQFNRVLETRDTPRGLVVNMGDVLFATGKFNLKPEAQIVLAKLSGIILSHPGLNLAVEGYTDTVGSDDFNMKLSQQRADTVHDYLVGQGLTASSVTSQGFGKADPVADNGTAAGRQKNRRVQIVVSGEIIGQKIGN
jgi:outer membrane protein OmpA-like peptidoglycan-associated protein